MTEQLRDIHALLELALQGKQLTDSAAGAMSRLRHFCTSDSVRLAARLEAATLSCAMRRRLGRSSSSSSVCRRFNRSLQSGTTLSSKTTRWAKAIIAVDSAQQVKQSVRTRLRRAAA
jgi:hypothetical protein